MQYYIVRVTKRDGGSAQIRFGKEEKLEAEQWRHNLRELRKQGKASIQFVDLILVTERVLT